MNGSLKRTNDLAPRSGRFGRHTQPADHQTFHGPVPRVHIARWRGVELPFDSLGTSYNARWYDGKLGRFVSADTIVPGPGNPQSFNRYAYVLNNPLKYVDPSGHREVDCSASENCDSQMLSNSPFAVLQGCSGSVTCEQTYGGQWLISHPNYNPYTDPNFGQHPGYQNILVMMTQMQLDNGSDAQAAAYWMMANEGAVSQAGIDAPISLVQGVTIGATVWGVQRSFFGKLLGSRSYLRSLPKWTKIDDPTRGILVAGDQEFSLRSGRGPATQMPEGAPGYDAITRYHVEGHASATMHNLQVNEAATLYINNAPCPNCLRNLKYMLPEGTSLRVVGINRETGVLFDQVFSNP